MKMRNKYLLTTSLTSYALIGIISPLQANPLEGNVVRGTANITSNGKHLDITQSSEKAVIDWRSFNIEQDEITTFHQPSSSSLTVNRVNDGNPSHILGKLSANGNLVLINRSGIMFGQDAVVDVNSLVATTSDISNDDVMNGNMNFHGTGGTGSVINNGIITAAEAGLVGLVAPTVENNGIINARLGKVQLASGDAFTLDLYGDGLMNIAASPDMTAGMVKNNGAVNADGGVIEMTAAAGANLVNSLIDIAGELKAPSVGIKNGKIIIGGGNTASVGITGKLNAKGKTGGTIKVTGKNIVQQGHLDASGTDGKGGTISLGFYNAYLDSDSSSLTATGTNENGGLLSVTGEPGSRAFISGTYDTSSFTDLGGTINITAAQGDLKLFGAHVYADGATGGGAIHIGGELQGGGSLAHAATTSVNFASVMSASSTESGDGGEAIIWSDETTLFGGKIYATGGSISGDGGQIEISSKDTLKLAGNSVTDASAEQGEAGNLLLDPKNITIATGGISGGISYFELVDPNVDAGAFSGNLLALSSGNIVVTDSTDDLMAANAGAVYLFNGATGALISTLYGTTANDRVGIGVTALTNGNFVTSNYLWDNGAIADAGAVTWGSGTTGISGAVSTSNSLYGTTASDSVGTGTVALSNGNYVAFSQFWDNGAATNAGAVTWGNGTTGITGAVSSAISLVGTTANDSVGSNGMYEVAGSNYVVVSSAWNNGAATAAGAITWGSGSTGITGAVSSANSLVGSNTSDQVGTTGGFVSVNVLANGNYLVRSRDWNNGAVVDAGAVTWGNGLTGVTGVVSAANSLVGTSTSDRVGASVNFLGNTGNTVIVSSLWDNGATTDVGAVTFIDGATGITGAVSSTNSLIGSTASDSVGGSGITVLTNNNYVVRSLGWDNGAVASAGAVTWGSGTTGVSGVVSAANSLVGSTINDQIGGVIVALSNGNYVVSSTNWDNGAITNAGAATWGNGLGGTVGTISAANSLVGSTAGDGVGAVTALFNGNYVVRTSSWDNGAITNAGAVTWGNGLGGTVGTISAANSLVGSTASDQIGTVIRVLNNGNYVVGSNSWDNGAVTNAGAATWGNGLGGTVGTISAANSLVGSTASDGVGTLVYALTNGNYVVDSSNWDNGAATNAGAVTWGDGTSGVVGTVSAANSLVGTASNHNIGIGGTYVLTNGNYVVSSYNWDNGATTNVGAVTWGNGATGTVGGVSAANSIVGTTALDLVGFGMQTLSNGNYLILNSSWDNGAALDAGAVTWGNGSGGTVGAVSAANSLVGSTSGDVIANYVSVLPNGNYLVRSDEWDNGATVNPGVYILGNSTTGTSGVISSQNAIIDSTSGGDTSALITTDSVNGRTLVKFTTSAKIYSLNNDYPIMGSYDSYADVSTSSVTLDPTFITNVLNAGTNVTLQANNDITVNNNVTANNGSGSGGTFTLQAGRSILINANITTDNGNLNIFANEALATGVVDAQRDAGAAVINMAVGTTLDAGTGDVSIRLDDGTGKTNNTAGDISLRTINAGSILVQNKNATGDVVLESGGLTASELGDAITLVSSRNFINNIGAGALTATTGRWLVYSTNPANDTIGSLPNDFRRFSCTYGGSCPSMPGGINDGLLYSYTPTLTITPSALAAIQYGDAVPSLTGYGYSVSGYLGSDSSNDNLTGSLNGSTTYTVGSGVGSYNINHASGSLSSAMGYSFTYANNASAITVNKKDITASFAASLTKVYGDANPTIDYNNFTFSSLVGSDSASLFSSITPNYGAVDANTGVSVGNAVTATIASTANYNVTNTPATTLAITARPLTVTTDSKSKIFGAADPFFTGSDNLTANDAALISWLYAPMAYGGAVGTYTIGATATDPSSRLSNYSRTNAYGNLTVNAVAAPPPSPTTPVLNGLPNTYIFISQVPFDDSSPLHVSGWKHNVENEFAPAEEMDFSKTNIPFSFMPDLTTKWIFMDPRLAYLFGFNRI